MVRTVENSGFKTLLYFIEFQTSMGIVTNGTDVWHNGAICKWEESGKQTYWFKRG